MFHFFRTKKRHYFYDAPVFANREEEYIENLLAKYKNEPATEDLKKKIWDELQMATYEGKIKIPFKVSLRKDVYGKFPDFVEIILDTKL